MGLIVGLFVLGLVLSTMVGGGSGPEESVHSSEPTGRRALWIFLSELGYAPRSWSSAPLALSTGEHLLWLPRTPVYLESEEEEEDSDEIEEDGLDPILSDPRHPANYGRFVRSGGTLLITGEKPHLDWLREDCGLDLPAWTPVDSGPDVLWLELDSGERLRLVLEPDAVEDSEPHAASPAWDPDDLEGDGWHHLAVGSDGRPFASWIAVEGGRVWLLADDRFLENQLLGEGDNGLFVARVTEGAATGGELLFDEFALGAWNPPTKLELLARPGWLEFGYHALALLLLLVLYHAWRREFPRDPERASLDPRARLRSGARLLERAGRHDLLARDLRQGGLERLQRRFGGPGDEERWAAALGGASVSSNAELEDLAGRLDRLEKSVARAVAQADTTPRGSSSRDSAGTSGQGEHPKP
jgi:hypothetical protein